MFDLWVRKFPCSRKWQPTPVSLPGEFRGQGSLAGYSLWGRKESGRTEQLTHSPHIQNKGLSCVLLPSLTSSSLTPTRVTLFPAGSLALSLHICHLSIREPLLGLLSSFPSLGGSPRGPH